MLAAKRRCSSGWLVVTSDVPARNMKEFMAWIRANRSKLPYGSYGIGSHGQLACATLSEVANADMAHVAYKGEAPMIADLLGGQIKMGMGSLLSLKAHLDSGKLRALALIGWLAMAGPKDMPANVAQQWALAANQAVANREGMARIIAAGFIPVDDDTPEKFARLWAQEAPIWGQLPQAAGVQPT